MAAGAPDPSTTDVNPAEKWGMAKESRYNIWVERGETAYVYNGVSGGLLAVSKEDFRALQRVLANVEGATCSPELIENLVRGRMLVSEDFDEVGFLSRRYDASRWNSSGFALTIVTSLGCNFDCPYCFEAKHPSIMDGAVQQAVLHILDDQLPRIKVFKVSWFGGEPLVGKRSLLALSDEFIARCGCAGVEYEAAIITNGYLLDEETCAQLRDRKVTHAQVTLDGPPEVHDRMRPLVNGKGTFRRILGNLIRAIDYIKISIRVNIDKNNIIYTEELLKILAGEGLAGKVSVSPGRIHEVSDNPLAPAARYGAAHCCFTNPEYARAERQFMDLATAHGFSRPALPRPTGAPCTAVRSNELVVGSKGELYKCWDSVGIPSEVVGDIRDYENPNGRLQKWLKYDPFSNDECRGCIALPVCMGGCAHHAMDPLQYENRCVTFRHNYSDQIIKFIEFKERTGFVSPAPSDRPA
jgi:uncharacterized protein